MTKKKLKIPKSLLRRIKVTARGKVLHRSSFLRHLRSSKKKSRIRRLKNTQELPKNLSKKVRTLMGVGVKRYEDKNRSHPQAKTQPDSKIS